jgi:hypothetical protein
MSVIILNINFTAAPITSLVYNPWPRNIHLAIGLNNGEIKVYSGLLDSTPELVASLDQSKVHVCMHEIMFIYDIHDVLNM